MASVPLSLVSQEFTDFASAKRQMVARQVHCSRHVEIVTTKSVRTVPACVISRYLGSVVYNDASY